MTCIVALTDGKTVHMAGDSGCCFGQRLVQLEESKVFVLGEMLIGDSGPVRAGQILRHAFTPPPVPATKDLTGYLAGAFYGALVAAFAESDLRDKADFCDALIGLRGRLYHLSADGAVTMDARRPYHAVGNGAPYALGAMFAAPKMSPRERLALGLEAATHHVAGIIKPYSYLYLESVADRAAAAAPTPKNRGRRRNAA